MVQKFPKVTVKDVPEEVSVKALLSIDDTDLPNEYACQAARFAYYAVLAAHAERAWLNAVRLRKAAEAEAFVFFKNSVDDIPKGGRTVSDSLANNLVACDAEVREYRNREVETQYQWHMMRDLAKSFEQRANMLQSLGANLRHEQDMTGRVVRDDPIDNLRRAITDRKSV